MTTFRIATMDCAVEEGEIRNALEGVPGIKALRFRLGERTLAIDGPAPTIDAALVAIRRAGFDPEPVMPAVHAPKPGTGGATFRIATMDCALEEGEIRNALERVPGIKALRFQLGTRTLGIDAPPATLESALAAIRGAGFDPQPVAPAGDGGEVAEPHDHTETTGPKRLALALALALAELHAIR